MTDRPQPWRRLPSRAALLLAALAYLPALTAAPGRMPADSKLYLYLDPQRLMSDALHNFDPRQFAGWVPHQHIAYLWPSGPWFGVFELLRVPDWIAHRLWIGTLLLLAGLGVRWSARLLGLTATGALAAAVVYQLSPYLLPYVSRTSVMLLPWAGLGWIVGLTVLATLRSRWRHAALLALVIVTVGAVNATALVLIVPAPALWLVHAALTGQATWRRVLATAARVSALCAAVSLWWVAALVLQGRHGADVLAFSETLEAVSFTSTSTEVTRGLGYWLFYLRDPYAATTTAAVDHLVSGRTIAIGLALVVVCVVGLATTTWTNRRYAALLVLCGIVLGVGIHPIDRPSPLMSALTGDGESGLALALRSSTRAVPVSLFGFALGAGALVSSLRRCRWRDRIDVGRAALVGVVVLAVAGLPALWSGGFVDPALERDQDPPAAWREAARYLDDVHDRRVGDGAGTARVLQVPGAEFGAFRWGYTVDQPLPGMTDAPVVTRDLLPLGSPAAMDLLYAFDDRFQRGTLEPDSIAPIARLFGAGTVWIANDLAWDRFRTPRPDDVAAALAESPSGLGEPRSFGEPEPNVPHVEMLDERAIVRGPDPAALPPVQLHDVEDPAAVVRAKRDVVVIAGNGDGIVDAAAAGLIDGTELVVYAASLDEVGSADPGVAAAPLIVTDTNRDRARHWRSSQDTVGFTEDGGPDGGVLRPADGDARLDVFERTGPAHQTTAHQIGPVTARATAYGEPFAYRPERRAVMAVDGDVTTAWTVADRFEAVGETLVLDLAEAADHLTFRQPDAAPGARRIAAVEVRVDGGPATSVALDERSLAGAGQREAIEVAAGSSVSITIVATTADPTHPERLGPVGFAEVDAGLGPTLEVVRPPSDALDRLGPDTPVSIVLTRERVRPTDRWRDDPEPALVRQLSLPVDRAVDATVTVRLDQRAGDGVLADLFGLDAPTSSQRLTGSAAHAGWSAFDGRDDTAWTSRFGDATGAHLDVRLDSAPGRLDVHQVDDGLHSLVTALRISDDAGGVVDAALVLDADGAASVDVSALSGRELRIEITAVEPRTTIDRRYGEPTILPVAIRRIDGDGVPAVTLPTTIDTGCRDDLLALDGQPVPLRVRGELRALLAGDAVTATPCTDAASLALGAGEHLLTATPGAATGLHLDRIVLSSASSDGVGSGGSGGDDVAPVVVVRSEGRTGATVDVERCTDGCWLVLGHGLNDAWRATLDGEGLGEPVLVDGGFNGWWLEPGDGTRTVTIEWTPQPILTAALVLSLLAVLGCVMLAVLDRRHRAVPAPDRPDAPRRLRRPERTQPRRALAGATLAWAIVAALVIAPAWGVVALLAGAAMVALRTQRVAGAIAVVGIATSGALLVSRVVRFRPVPDAGWVLIVEDLHRPGLFVVTALAASAFLLDRGRAPRADERDDADGREHGDHRLHRGAEPVGAVEDR